MDTLSDPALWEDPRPGEQKVPGEELLQARVAQKVVHDHNRLLVLTYLRKHGPTYAQSWPGVSTFRVRRSLTL